MDIAVGRLPPDRVPAERIKKTPSTGPSNLVGQCNLRHCIRNSGWNYFAVGRLPPPTEIAKFRGLEPHFIFGISKI